jgi:hypothetical protein
MHTIVDYAKLSLHLYVLTGVNTMTRLTKAIDTTLSNQKFQPYIIKIRGSIQLAFDSHGYDLFFLLLDYGVRLPSSHPRPMSTFCTLGCISYVKLFIASQDTIPVHLFRQPNGGIIAHGFPYLDDRRQFRYVDHVLDPFG